MSNIKFYIPKGQTIPLTLWLNVDGIEVIYSKVDSGYEFSVWYVDKEKAMEVVQEIIKQIKLEQDDLKNGVVWVATSLEITSVNERFGYVTILWKYRMRDTG